jgi:tetratricopeptide (TPR) repeat protein
MKRNFILGTVLLSLFALAGMARAQDPLLEELYGQGVHAYYQGEYSEAHDLLTAAIDEGSRDPRCFYFRGLAYEKLGRPDEADADFAQGAELEAKLGTQFYAVGRSLERVQGEVRLKLEAFRQVARVEARRNELQRKADRYEQFQRDEGNVLRGNTTAPETLPTVPDNGEDDPTAPFGGTPRAVTPTPRTTDPPPTPANDDDPFGTGGAAPPKTPAADDDPFGGGPATPPKTPAADDDPFGAAEEKPATPPAPAPAAPAPAADDDPFGATEEKPATPAAPAPAADDDPFGAAAPKPATPPAPAPAADDDPFGATEDKPATPPAPAPAADDDPLGSTDDTPEAPPKPVEDDNPFE